jgi:hypothetical protein
MGPTAYPRRASPSEDPIGPLGHHLENSTHVSDDVITAGFTYRRARIEVPVFTGCEPDEFRWDIDSGKIDSWYIRATFNPAPIGVRNTLLPISPAQKSFTLPRTCGG